MPAAKAKAKPKTDKAPATNGAAQPAGQALFYSNPYPLDKKRHAKAGLRADAGFGFARKTNSILLNIDDIPEAARSYPIVFGSDPAEPRPMAVVGLGEENVFIDNAGQWDPHHYVPSYVRRYPFGFAPVPDSDDFVLCVDEDAPHYAAKGADVLFFDKGEPSQLSNDALQFCAAFQKQMDETGEFAREVAKAGLLESKSMQATLKDGVSKSLSGFQMIEPERWHEFAKKNASAWEKKRYLSLVILILASQANWKYLTLRG